MDKRWSDSLGEGESLEDWIEAEVSLSTRFWLSSKKSREHMRDPFFDKNQTNVLAALIQHSNEPLEVA